MKYFSTTDRSNRASFKEAVIKGLPSDNGLYMPEYIPKLSRTFFDELPHMSLSQIAYEVLQPFVQADLTNCELQTISEETFAFPIPLKRVSDDIYSLELFHGPTCAFKDVGARFLARCMSHFALGQDKKVTVLVATSGDTGSAVANGFLGVENVEVVILYPSKKVSHIQEQQLTTLGQNIKALEVEGTFDDCQRLVKTSFLDKELNQTMQLTSANSINIARLLPQSIYYHYAIAQLGGRDVIVSVPSGNFGNLTAGLIAEAMGLPVKHFIAATNRNDIVPNYLETGEFKSRPSVTTISNAMDVGNPSNFPRMQSLFKGSHVEMKSLISGASFNDDETRQTIKSVKKNQNYVLDPHGAIGYSALSEYLNNNKGTGVFLETAHPAKFIDVMEKLVGDIAIPSQLQKYLDKEKKSTLMPNSFEELKSFLLVSE